MRKNRILCEGAIYHVSSKVNREEHIFKQDEFKDLFLKIIKKAKKKYKFSIYNFVVMDNHYHLIIKPLKNENLSRIMQWILSVFSIYYNKINKLKGHTWIGRFFSKIINGFKQFLDTFKYISNNPVKANLVQYAKDYKYSGLYHLLNKIFDIIDFKI